MKREFIAYWASELVNANVHKMPADRASYFREFDSNLYSREIILPEVSYDKLAVFAGRKTKITIEVVE